MLTQPPLATVVDHHEPRQRLPRDAVVLDQAGDLHPRVQQCGDDLAEPAVPLIGDVVVELDVGLDVGPRLIPHLRVGLFEIG